MAIQDVVIDTADDVLETTIYEVDEANGQGDIASGSIGQGDRLDGTALEGSTILAVNVMRYEDPENDDLVEFGVGTDGSESVLNVDVLSTREHDGSGFVDTDMGPRTEDGVSVDLLDFYNEGADSGTMIDADVVNPAADHDAIVSAEILTSPDYGLLL